MTPERIAGRLETGPELFRLLLEDLTEADALWKPSPDRWSIAQVLEHLSHVEGHGFRLRLERMLEEDYPLLEVYDQEALAAEGRYDSGDPEESFAHFEDQRADNAAFVRDLEPVLLARRGRHARLGDITVSDLLHEWVFHDLGHLRQVAELIRARKYYPEMGAFREYYHIEP